MSRILFVTKSPPVPTSIGGNQRANLLYRALSALGRVDLIIAGTLSVQEQEVLRGDFNLIDNIALPSAGQHGQWRILQKLSNYRIDWLAHHLEGIRWMYQREESVSARIEKHLVEGKYSMVVGCPADIIARSDPFRFCPVVLDNHDLAATYYQSRLDAVRRSGLNRLFLRRHLRQLKKVLPPLFGRCAKVFVSNENDRLFPGLERGVLLPNIPFPDRLPENPFPSRSEGAIALTVGAFSHKPNEDGVDYFVCQVWPFIRHHIPSAQFRVVGTGITDSMRERWMMVPGVKVIGYVPHLALEYRSAAFAVVPIRWGSGTNIKVLEALAYGRTCVLTPFALRGYENTLRHNESLLISSNARRFGENCVRLFNDPTLRTQFAANGSRLISTEYSYNRFHNTVVKSVGPLLTKRNAGA